jgi:hypothetical protein
VRIRNPEKSGFQMVDFSWKLASDYQTIWLTDVMNKITIDFKFPLDHCNDGSINWMVKTRWHPNSSKPFEKRFVICMLGPFWPGIYGTIQLTDWKSPDFKFFWILVVGYMDPHCIVNKISNNTGHLLFF